MKIAIRKEVQLLPGLGPFPAEGSLEASQARVDQFDELLRSIVTPLSDEEARLLVKLFGQDDF